MPLNLNIKRILFIAGFILAVFAMGFAIYWVFFRTAPPDEITVNENINGGILPDITNQPPDIITNINEVGYLPEIDLVASGGDTLTNVIVDAEAGFPTLGANGSDLHYYDPISGKFYQVDANGNIIGMLSDQVFPNAENVTWSHGAESAVIEFPDGSNIFYDFNKEEQYTLPKEMQEFTFSENDEQIAYKYYALNTEDNWLGVASPDGSGAIGVSRLGNNGDKVDINWSPSGQAVGTYTEYSGSEEQSVIPVGLKGENFKAMKVQGMQFNYQWSENGSQMLYDVHSSATENKPMLWVVDAYGDDIGKNRVPLNVNTWEEKCAFSSDEEIYCGVPTSMDTGAGFVPSTSNDIPDQIYKINLKTKTKSLVATPVDEYGFNDFTVEQMYITENNNYIYFTDKQTGKIYKIKLK